MDKTTNDTVSVMTARRAAMIRSYKVWVLSPIETTDRDLRDRLSFAIERLRAYRWNELPELDIALQNALRGWRRYGLYMAIVALLAGLIAIGFFGNSLGSGAATVGSIVGIVVVGLLSQAGITLGSLQEATDISSKVKGSSKSDEGNDEDK